MIYKDARRSSTATTGSSANTTPAQMHVSIYCRISLDAAAEGLGVERQETECRRYAAAHGWAIDHVYTDNSISATTGKRRPQWEAMLEANPEHLLVWHTDRAVRLTKDLDEIVERRIFIHAVTAGHLDLSTPAGVAVAKTITTWAEYEGKQKALRQKASHRQRAESGKPWWTGNARPFGFNENATVRQNEHDALKECFRIVREGGTYAQAAQSLTNRGLTTTRGKAWNSSKLTSTMRMPYVAGLNVYQGEIVAQGTWTPVVSEEEWTAVVGGANHHMAKATSKPNTSGTDKRVKSLLGGITTCKTCGEPFSQRWRNRDGVKRRIYQPGCHHVSIDADWLDEHVTKVVLRELAKPPRMLLDGPGVTETEATTAAAAAVTARAKLEAFATMEAVMALSSEQVAERERLQVELETATAKAADFYSASPLDRVYSPGSLLVAWKSDDLTLQHKREAVTKVIESLTVRPRLNRNERTSADMLTLKIRR